MAMSPPVARFLLKSSGRNLNNARNTLEKAKADVARDIVLARKHGLSITEIAQLSGVSRQTVYDILKKQETS